MKIPSWAKYALYVTLLLLATYGLVEWFNAADSVPLSEIPDQFKTVDVKLITPLGFILTDVLLVFLVVGNAYYDAKQINAGKVVIVENGVGSAVDHGKEAAIYVLASLIIPAIIALITTSSILLAGYAIIYSIVTRWAFFDIILNLLRGKAWNYTSDTSSGDQIQSVLWFMKNSRKDIPRAHVICMVLWLILTIIPFL
jgi:hypothetical protein